MVTSSSPRSDSPRLRALLIAEAANPEWVSVPLVGWSHAEAIARRVDAHLVTQVRNVDAIERVGWRQGREFTALDSEAVARGAHRFGQLIRGGSGKGWTAVTAAKVPAYLWFEHLLWRRFKGQLENGSFDVVHRITPLSPTTPSFLGQRLQRLGIPYVVGPLNGGVPWPRQFQQARRAEREWLSYVRGAYRFLPGIHSQRRLASALIVGSRDTRQELAAETEPRVVYMPENAVDERRFDLDSPRTITPASRPLQVSFVGRLVPYKGADMLLEAAAPLLRTGRLTVSIFGDGPQKSELLALRDRLGISTQVEFAGWVEHKQLQERLRQADVLGFPSVREFGGGVVLEAMALGVVPLVVAYGGPQELVTASSGVALELGTRAEIIDRLRTALNELAADRSLVEDLSAGARRRVRRHFTWDRKAEHTVEIYEWVLGRRPKPDRGMPFSDDPSAG